MLAALSADRVPETRTTVQPLSARRRSVSRSRAVLRASLSARRSVRWPWGGWRVRTRVPKPVDEYGEPVCGEDYVGPASPIEFERTLNSETEASAVKLRAQSQLRTCSVLTCAAHPFADAGRRRDRAERRARWESAHVRWCDTGHRVPRHVSHARDPKRASAACHTASRPRKCICRRRPLKFRLVYLS